MKRFLTAFAALVFMGSGGAHARSLSIVKAGLVSYAPIVDGIIRDGEWQGAVALEQFRQTTTGDPAAQTTSGWVGWDSSALYIALECSSSDAPHIYPADTRRDGDIAQSDHVEVYLDPSGRAESYYRFAINRAGGVYDAYVMDKSYDAHWSAAVSEKPGGWSVEFRIPYTSVGISSANPPAAAWGANFCRGYVSPTGGEGEFSAWSPTLLPKPVFNVPKRFGLLEGVGLNVALFPVDPRMNVTFPDRWYSGPNYTTLRVTMNGDKPIRARLACLETPTGRQIATTPVVQIRPGPAQPVAIYIEGSETSPANRMFVLFDADDAQRVLASSPVVDCATAPGLQVRVLSPAFRNVVQSRDSEKLLWVRCYIGEVQKQILRCRVRLVGREDGKDYWRRDPRVTPRSVRDFRRKMDFPVGDYRLLVDLLDRSGASLASEEIAVRVLPESALEMSFSPKRACFVNGRPFLPIGLALPDDWAAEPDGLCSTASNHGFNLLQADYGPLSEGMISASRRNDLYLISGTNESTREEIESGLGAVQNLLVWRQTTDPDPSAADTYAEMRTRLATQGPQRPLAASFTEPDHLDAFSDCFDLIVTGSNPIRYAPMTAVSSWIGSALAGVGERTPVWARLQAFGAKGTIYDQPTEAELRCQAYLSLVSGATGIIWDVYGPKTGSDPQQPSDGQLEKSPVWDYLGKLNAELTAVAPAILQSTSSMSLEASDPAVHARFWRHGRKTYIIAVNTAPRDITCSFSRLIGFEAVVLFEDRLVPINTTHLRDSFKPYEVHVYTY